MSKHFLSIAIFLLSISLIFCGFQLGKYSINEQEVKSSETDPSFEKGLMKIEETAKYLALPVKTLETIVNTQKFERDKLTSFDTYAFIPYIEIYGEKYFNKEQVDEWIKYNSTWREIN